MNPCYRDYYFLGWSFKPNSGGEWQALKGLKINRFGFRGKDFEIEKKEGVFRIVCFGGSTSHSGNYPEKLQAFFDSDKNSIKNIEIINAAVPKWNSTQNLIQYITRVIYLSPDLIIFYDSINDNDSRDYKWLYNLQEVDYKKYGSFMQRHSLVYNLILNRINNLLIKIKYILWSHFVGEKPLIEDKITKFSTQIFRMNLESFIILAKARGTKVVLITMPLNYEMKNSYKEKALRAGYAYRDFFESLVEKVRYNNNEIRSVAEKYGISLIDMEESGMNTHPDYFLDLCHFSEEGASFFAEKVKSAMAPIVNGIIKKKEGI